MECGSNKRQSILLERTGPVLAPMRRLLACRTDPIEKYSSPMPTMPKFVARQRKHKSRHRDGRSGKSDSEPGNDSNVTELLPVTRTEKEEKRQQLKEDLRAQQPKVSSKKQKRLDKYIVCVLELSYSNRF